MAELILSLKDRELSRHALGAVVRVGRDPENEVWIDNVGVSRHHATVVQEGSSFVVKDEASQNGVYVNGQRVSVQPLRDGDVVQIGKFSLRLNVAGNGAAAPHLAERSLPPARDMAKTLALAPGDVQRLVEAQREAKNRAANLDAGAEEADGSVRVLVIGLLVIVVVATIAYFLLIH